MDNIKELLTFDEIIKNNLIEKQLIKQAELSGVDLYECNINRWKSLLQEVGAILFNDSKILKIDKETIIKDNNIKNNYYNIYNSSMNVFDIKKLSIICDIYIYLSQKYNKYIKMSYFGYLLNFNCMKISNILNIKMHNNNVCYNGVDFNQLRLDIYKRLNTERENNLEEKCFYSPGAIGSIAIGNKDFGWNGQTGTAADADKVYQIDSLPTMAELPQNPENTDLLQDDTSD